WALAATAGAMVYRRRMHALWRESTLRRPVLVLESDDWGAGPHAQASALGAVSDLLARHRDVTGRPPSLSLAIVLAMHDFDGTNRAGGRHGRVELDAPTHAPVLDALRAGSKRSVFSLQLHGHEHFRPQTLVASADPAVKAWLAGGPLAATERLPSHLQSRWVDASTLPSRPLGSEEIASAVEAECAAFARITGSPARVVVPPTFVWTREVERAWAAAGVEFVVTPGFRSTRRDAAGLPDGDEGPIANGDRDGPITYLVRSDYFEPVRGRGAEHALRALDRAVAEGRPCILENHRDNFIFDEAQCRRSLEELDALLAGALSRHTGVRSRSRVGGRRVARKAAVRVAPVARDRPALEGDALVRPRRDRRCTGPPARAAGIGRRDCSEPLMNRPAVGSAPRDAAA
nr:hypothetical protein [Rubrivivax sp.]